MFIVGLAPDISTSTKVNPLASREHITKFWNIIGVSIEVDGNENGSDGLGPRFPTYGLEVGVGAPRIPLVRVSACVAIAIIDRASDTAAYVNGESLEPTRVRESIKVGGERFDGQRSAWVFGQNGDTRIGRARLRVKSGSLNLVPLRLEFLPVGCKVGRR
jgi:hypothetical protein